MVGFHTEKVVLTSIGKFLEGSRAEKVLVTAEIFESVWWLRAAIAKNYYENNLKMQTKCWKNFLFYLKMKLKKYVFHFFFVFFCKFYVMIKFFNLFFLLFSVWPRTAICTMKSNQFGYMSKNFQIKS